MSGTIAPAIPRATVRLQLHEGFDFAAAAETVPYYQRLGISHFYLSPILQAAQGSNHGYDCIDPTRVSETLGGRDGFRRLVATLREHGMGVLVDIVPNHLATHLDNAWWRDVLVWGRQSRYADHFDIDWQPADSQLRDRVLLPWLDGSLEQALADGAVTLGWNAGAAELAVNVGELSLPLGARTYAELFGDAAPALSARFAAAAEASASGDFDAARNALHDFAQRDGTEVLAAVLRGHDGSDEASRARLSRLLERQPYVLDDWRNAGRRNNWRRFFDVGGLIGMRVEREDVFEDMHRELFALYAEGLIDGVRIDHIDGLAAPEQYLRRLTGCLEQLDARRPAGVPPGPAYLLVEKILAEDERLPRSWPVAGSTGYDFMAQVDGLLHCADGEPALTALWQQVGGAESFEVEARQGKRDVLASTIAADVERAVSAAHALLPGYGRDAVARALVEFVVHADVYRTYLGEDDTVSADDRAVIDRAVAAAAAKGYSHDRELLARLLARVMGDDAESETVDPELRRLAIRRLQQLMTVSAAKGIEDTAFYRYGRLLSRNEVGAEPGRLALPLAAFHAACEQRARAHPHGMLATATHDHKRGEDVRARLAVLSARPDEWSATVREWRTRNQALRRADAPHPADELMLYQMLVGAWPLRLRADDEAGAAQFADRIAAWQQKALREGKRRSSWIDPDPRYEDASEAFMRALLADVSFRRSAAAFVDGIAADGARRSLVRALLRLTVPGVPDQYQGTELWDFSLVDPDNRSLVDHALRLDMLGHVPDDAQLLRDWRNGQVKQQLIARVLAARENRPSLFASGGYRPLTASGGSAEDVVAFARSDGDHHLVAIASLRRAGGDADTLALEDADRRDGAIHGLPTGIEWFDVIGCRRVDSADGDLPLAHVFGPWPLALLIGRARR